jgi:hypothetical protein
MTYSHADSTESERSEGPPQRLVVDRAWRGRGEKQREMKGTSPKLGPNLGHGGEIQGTAREC